MAGIPLGTPVEIAGREVVITKDVVGFLSRRNHEGGHLTSLQRASGDHMPEISIDENDLKRLRDSYPGINVYGAWQILFHNNLVPSDEELSVVKNDEKDGLYIYRARDSFDKGVNGFTGSGEYIDNYSPDLIDYTLENAYVIDVDLSQLRLPKETALLRRELQERERAETQRKWYFTAAICISIISVAVAANFYLNKQYQARLTTYNAQKNELVTLEDKVAGLLTRKLPVYPSNEKLIEKVVQIVQHDPMVSTPEAGLTLSDGTEYKSSFANPHQALITRKGFKYDISTKFSWLVSTDLQSRQQLLQFEGDQ